MRTLPERTAKEVLAAKVGVLFAAALFFLPSAARAANVSVDCNAGGSINTTLSTLDLVGPHTITVTGTCTERVNIFNRDRVTIQASPGQTATIVSPTAGFGRMINIAGSHSITLRRLLITGGRAGIVLDRGSEVTVEEITVEKNAASGVQLFSRSSLHMSFSNVRRNGRTGISANDSTLAIDGGATIENNGRSGVTAISSRVLISGDVGSENIVRGNSGAGLSIANASTAEVSGANTIANNTGFGVMAIHASALTLFEATVEGNGETGVHVGEVSHGELGDNIIRNNGGSSPFSSGGVAAVSNGDVSLDGGNKITNNTGPGVFVDQSSTVMSSGGNTVSTNTEDGVRLIRQAVGRFLAPDTIVDNGNANLFCDTTSLVAGDLTGVTNIKCTRIEREHGPPRPGRIHDLTEPVDP
ncbi:MAG: right-handed parallel beta-helix repeat-containing protein [Pyrinomonadaceae bacterium]